MGTSEGVRVGKLVICDGAIEVGIVGIKLGLGEGRIKLGLGEGAKVGSWEG